MACQCIAKPVLCRQLDVIVITVRVVYYKFTDVMYSAHHSKGDSHS